MQLHDRRLKNQCTHAPHSLHCRSVNLRKKGSMGKKSSGAILKSIPKFKTIRIAGKPKATQSYKAGKEEAAKKETHTALRMTNHEGLNYCLLDRFFQTGGMNGENRGRKAAINPSILTVQSMNTDNQAVIISSKEGTRWFL